MSSLKVVTFSDTELTQENKLLQSCEQYNLNLTILKHDEKWTSNAVKIKLLYDFLANEQTDQVLLVTDAFDVLINATEADIMGAFLSLQGDIIFGAEANFYFRNHKIKKSYQHNYPQSPTLYRYLNSGTFIGKTGHIKKLLDHIIQKNDINITDIEDISRIVSDQYVYTKHFVEHSLSTDREYSLELDHHHSLFEVTGGRSRVMSIPHMSNTHSYNSFKLERAVLKFFNLTKYQNTLIDIRFYPETKQYKNTLTGTQPLIIHLPGSRKYFNEVIEGLQRGRNKNGRIITLPAKVAAIAVSFLCYIVALCIPVKLTI